MIVLHGPDGTELHVRKDAILAMHVAKANAPSGAATTLHLANGQEWSVKEALHEIEPHIGTG